MKVSWVQNLLCLKISMHLNVIQQTEQKKLQSGPDFVSKVLLHNIVWVGFHYQAAEGTSEKIVCIC